MLSVKRPEAGIDKMLLPLQDVRGYVYFVHLLDYVSYYKVVLVKEYVWL